MSSSVGSALKLKVSLYTGLTEPRTAEVLLHLTNLLWFIRDTLTNTPEGQVQTGDWARQAGVQPLARGKGGWGHMPTRVPGPHYSQPLQPEGVIRGNRVH